MRYPRAGALRLVVSLFALAFTCSCGGSSNSTPHTSTPGPTSPSDVPADVVNIAGTWAGTLESANLGVQPITVTIVQNGNCVDGTWRSNSQDSRGAISGFAGKNSFTGQLSFERGRCAGVADVTGEVGSDTLRWTATGVSPIGTCADPLPQTVVVSLRRQ